MDISGKNDDCSPGNVRANSTTGEETLEDAEREQRQVPSDITMRVTEFDEEREHGASASEEQPSFSVCPQNDKTFSSTSGSNGQSTKTIEPAAAVLELGDDEMNDLYGVYENTSKDSTRSATASTAVLVQNDVPHSQSDVGKVLPTSKGQDDNRMSTRNRDALTNRGADEEMFPKVVRSTSVLPREPHDDSDAKVNLRSGGITAVHPRPEQRTRNRSGECVDQQVVSPMVPLPPGESEKTASKSPFTSTKAPEENATQRDRAESPTSGNQPAAQVQDRQTAIVCPAYDQLSRKRESGSVYDQSEGCRNSDVDELLEASNEDASRNFNPHNADTTQVQDREAYSVLSPHEEQLWRRVVSRSFDDLSVTEGYPNSDADELERRSDDTDQNCNSSNSDVPLSTTPSAPGKSAENASQPLPMPTAAPQMDARQQDHDDSARAGSPMSGSQPAAQVPVSPANEAQSLGKVESETLVDVTQPEQSCPNSDADELLEERNDDVSQNFYPPDADVSLSPSAPGKSEENASQPLLMPAAAPQMDARQQDYDNTAGAGSSTSVSQPVPLSTTPSASGESVENAFQSLLMPTGAPEEDARQQDHDNSARARSPTSGNQPILASTTTSGPGESVENASQSLLMPTGAPEVDARQQDYDNSARAGNPISGSRPFSLRTIADHVVDLQRTTILPFAQQIYNGLLDAPPELSSLDSMRLISEHFSNRYRTIIIPRVQEVYRDFLDSPEQTPLEKRSVDRTRNCNALHIPNPGSQASDFVNGINNNIEFVDLESISEHLINRDRTTIIPMAREVYQALLQYPEQELPVPRAFVDDEEAETRDEERAFNDDTQM